MKDYCKTITMLLILILLSACSKTTVSIQQNNTSISKTVANENNKIKVDSSSSMPSKLNDNLLEILTSAYENFELSGNNDKYSEDERRKKYNIFLIDSTFPHKYWMLFDKLIQSST